MITIVCLINEKAFGQATVNDQDSYVLAINYGGEWYAIGQTINKESKAVNAIKIQVKDNSFISSEIAGIVWTFIKDTKGFNLKTEKGTFLQYTGNSTNIDVTTTSSNKGNKWIFEKQTNDYYIIKSELDPSYHLAFNPYTTPKRFKCYSAANYIDTIHLLPICNKNEATKSLTLKCTWSTEKLNSLDLSDITNVDMRNITIPSGYTPINANPNCLFYTSQNAEDTDNLPNLVKVDENNNATAQNIVLNDGHDFYNKIPFQGNITYTRHLYDGWSTIALPFPYIINEEHIEKFSNADFDYIHFTNVTEELVANNAYLIYMDVAADKTFIATNVEVPVTISAGNTFISNFITFTMPQHDTLYKLNNDGTEFNHSDNSAKVGAFRAYLDLSVEKSGSTTKRIIHDKNNATNTKNTNFKIYQDNKTLLIHADHPQNIGVYNLEGRKVYTLPLNTGINHINVPLKGLYLINNQKIFL